MEAGFGNECAAKAAASGARRDPLADAEGLVSKERQLRRRQAPLRKPAHHRGTDMTAIMTAHSSVRACYPSPRAAIRQQSRAGTAWHGPFAESRSNARELAVLKVLKLMSSHIRDDDFLQHEPHYKSQRDDHVGPIGYRSTTIGAFAGWCASVQIDALTYVQPSISTVP